MTELFGRLVIRVDKAEDLPHSDTTLWGGDGESDPYCVIKLDDEELARTTVFTDNSNPIWNERECFLNHLSFSLFWVLTGRK